jgi:hypothetical protein
MKHKSIVLTEEKLDDRALLSNVFYIGAHLSRDRLIIEIASD